MFIGTSVRQSIGDLATSLCANIVIPPELSPELVWSMLCGALQRPLMVIGNASGEGRFYTPLDGEVVVRPVRCDIATAEAVSTDELADHFPLTDPNVCVLMARENNLFERLVFTPQEVVCPTTTPFRRSIGRNDVRRIARRGGTKRMRTGFTEEVNTQLRDYLRKLVHDAAAIVDMRGKKTVRLEDVLHVLQKNGQTMYAC